MVTIIWFRFDLIRFWKYFSVHRNPGLEKRTSAVGEAHAPRHNGGLNLGTPKPLVAIILYSRGFREPSTLLPWWQVVSASRTPNVTLLMLKTLKIEIHIIRIILNAKQPTTKSTYNKQHLLRTNLGIQKFHIDMSLIVFWYYSEKHYQREIKKLSYRNWSFKKTSVMRSILITILRFLKNKIWLIYEKTCRIFDVHQR